MKWCSIAILFTVLSFSCSDDSTGPDNSGNGGGTEPVASETIGTEGGSIAADNITLTVPAGSFAGDAAIGISETDKHDYGDNAASETFLLSGIPGDFSAPLSLTVTYTGELANETYLVIEEAAEDPLSGETIRVPRYYSAYASDGQAAATIPARTLQPLKTAAAADEKELLDFYVTVITDYITEETVSHFIIKVPSHMESFFERLAPHLEESYDRIQNLGFNVSLPGNPIGDLDSIYVYAKSDVIDPPVFENIIPYNPPLHIMQVQSGYTGDNWLDTVMFDAARSVATLTAYSYSRHGRIANLWFDFAMADWFARYWCEPGAIPSPVTDDPMLAFRGIPAGPLTTDDEKEAFFHHARRFMPLLSYFDSEYNFGGAEKTLSRIYEERYNGAELAASIETITGLDPTEWWPDFIQAYMTGEVNQVDPPVFLASRSHVSQFTMTEDDTSHVFIGDFGDLAAEIYEINLDPSYTSNLSSIQFSAESSGLQDEYLELLLFGVKDGKPSYIGKGIDSIITDPGTFTDNDTFLVVVASCLLEYPYRDSFPYSLEVAGIEKAGTGEFTEIVLQLPYVWRDYEWVDNDGSVRFSGGAGGYFSWTLERDEWQKNGNTYTGTEISTSNSDFWGHYKKTSTITVTITDSGASASITQITENYDADATVTQTFEFWDLRPIPGDYYPASYGTTLEQNLDDEVWENFTYTYYSIANVDPEGYTREGDYYARGANIYAR